jgi:hypothetical protein
LRYLLWFVAGIALAAAGSIISVKVGDDMAGVVVGASILGGVAVAALRGSITK